MQRSANQLREDALAIWQAGLRAVDSQRLMAEHVQVRHEALFLGEERIPLNSFRRLLVVGAGKAGAGMAAGLEQALGRQLMQQKDLHGWINVPADCVRPLERIHLHPARPPGHNEPTLEGVAGTKKILELIAAAHGDDLCICLLSGGGSALLPAPAPGISLEDKQAVTRLLSGAGANIEELNLVRKQLSRIKGGGLARACGAGRLRTLIISDVLGDPLHIIASGPTVCRSEDPHQAIEILQRYSRAQGEVPSTVWSFLQQQAATVSRPAPPRADCRHCIIGNNAVAVDAAGIEAERRGYSHAMHAASSLEGSAELVGQHHAEMADGMRRGGPDCLITGGEPIVELAPVEERGTGGRNQQLVLAALQRLLALQPQLPPHEALRGLVLLSGGTDGEDGPTDAAGALIDAQVAAAVAKRQLDPASYLQRNDAYHFFQQVEALLRTGPTHTNVCDLRVVTVSQA